MPLRFQGPLLIVGGGQVAPDLLTSLAEHAAGIVGADRGGDTIIAAGLVPDAVIGDMDSVADPGAFGSPTTVVSLAEQDTTDFEKCLYSTDAPVTIAVGMTGGRFDHTLAALHAVTRYGRERAIILVDAHDLALVVSGSIHFSIAPGTRVSIYPLGRTEFAGSEGLEFPLEGLVLEQGSRIGTSNSAVAGTVSIAVAPGEQSPWLLILDRAHLGTLLAGLLP